MTAARAVATLAGILLVGYGGLVVLGVLAHESPIVGGGMAIAGAVLLLVAPRAARGEPQPAPDLSRYGRGHAVATLVLGASAIVAVLAYNLLAASDLILPEIAILAYGGALLAAAFRLDRRLGPTAMGTLVAWSLPLVAAPLGMWAVDAALDAGAGGSPLNAFIAHALVAPTAWTLDLMGFESASDGQSLLMQTPRGSLLLNVGLVCAGIEPGVLFLGAFGLFAWRERTPTARLAVLLALGLVGVYVANLIRLVALALVGYHWGGDALRTAHEHAGWILFLGWTLLFWVLVLRRFQGPARAPPVVG